MRLACSKKPKCRFSCAEAHLELLFSGLDIPKHNEPAYPVEAYGHGHIEKIIQILENTPTQVTQGKIVLFSATIQSFLMDKNQRKQKKEASYNKVSFKSLSGPVSIGDQWSITF